ncbi:probable serine/threonine-protein kinase kinX [Argiope bruennichi]|uniref:probable serine/threonine-protein kinase kinX n=1 Tax=Argiope bruennichi TaxID=94029 RepID=UPI002494564C|nr:probable serine/threonine-protein kinase kinX [Argiope bruennichi]
MNMNFFLIPAILFAFFHLSQAGPLRIQKRAAFYIANETACVVDNTVYNSGDPIPTDDPCEACRCRPPGFACVLKECESKPGCRAVRRAGQCCPEFICGCEHNGRMYRDGDEIRDSQNPCYTCHCQGSSIACAFVDCFFRVDCAPEYVPGECCPHYNHCASIDSDNSTNVDFALPTEKPETNEETTVSSKTSESPLSSEIPENIADTQVTKKENDKDSSEVLPPESLDSSLLFSANEEEESNKDTQTTKKDASSESVSDENSEEMLLDAAESSEESSSEKKIENVTEILNADFEIIKDEEKPTESEISPEQGPSEVSAIPETSAVTDKNVEIFPAEESTTAEVKFKTAPPAEVTGETTVSSTSIVPESFEDPDDKDNELSKRLRSLKNLTSDDATESPKENAEVKNEESKDDSTKEATEKVVTSPVTEKPTLVKLEKEIEVKDVKSSDATTVEVPKTETLNYNSDAKVAPETVETVTTVVEVKEQTSSEKVDVETSSSPAVSNEPEQVLFKALSGVAEENNKQETTVKSNEVTTSQTTVEVSDSATSKVADISTPSSLPPATDKSEEKVPLYADESKTVPSTEAPKVSEGETSTTVVAEVSSEKVEPSKD